MTCSPATWNKEVPQGVNWSKELPDDQYWQQTIPPGVATQWDGGGTLWDAGIVYGFVYDATTKTWIGINQTFWDYNWNVANWSKEVCT